MSELQGLIEHIYRSENSGRIDYNVVSGYIRPADLPPRPVTQMTVGEVLAWQRSIDSKYKTGEAAGAVQIIRPTLQRLVDTGKISETMPFDSRGQDQITALLIEGRGLREWQAGKITTEQFGNRLAHEWAALPLLMGSGDKARGDAAYGGDGTNVSQGVYSPDMFEQVLSDPGTPLASYPAARGGRRRNWSNGVNRNDRPDYDYTQHAYWRRNPLDNLGWLNAGDDGSDLPRDVYDAMPPAHPVDFQMQQGAGRGSPVKPGWWQAYGDEFSDAGIVGNAREKLSGFATSEFDAGFDPVSAAVAEGYTGRQLQYFARARNPDHYQWLKAQANAQARRDQRREIWDGYGAQTLGALTNPDSLVAIGLPGGIMVSATRRAGVSALRSATAGAAIGFGSEMGFEQQRVAHTLNTTPEESILRVGAATLFSGLFAGTIGGVAARYARRELASEIEEQIARQGGIGHLPDSVDIDGVKAPVRLAPDSAGPSGRGVTINVGEDGFSPVIQIDDAAIVRRWAAGDRSGGATRPDELLAYEIGRARGVALGIKRRMAGFLKSESGAVGPSTPVGKLDANGNVRLNRSVLNEAWESKAPLRVGNGVNKATDGILIDPAKFRSKKAFESFVRRATREARGARNTDELRERLGMSNETYGRATGDDVEPEAVLTARREAAQEAERTAAEELEAYRRRNNRILDKAYSEVLSRIQDSPFKRIHRGALDSGTRDLVNLLADDGTFMQLQYRKGLTLGPSVYSRARVWDGKVRELWDKERALWGRYLGVGDDWSVGDIHKSDFADRNMADKIELREFRERVAKSYITGVPDEIPEINELTQHVRQVYGEFREAGTRFGVITSREMLQARADVLRTRINELRKRFDNRNAGPDDLDEMAKLDAERADVLADLEKKMEEVVDDAEMAKQEPGEDYFTRVYSRAAIRENREAFLRLVKQWMRQQPMVQVWKPGKWEIRRQIRDLGPNPDAVRLQELQRLLADAPLRSKWDWEEASLDPLALNKRAEIMVMNILGEAEPTELSRLREPNRPAFGRHRQFDIPNSFLLKDGPNGNGVADFIETNYLEVMKVYVERMGPALEMARTFARPLDGVEWQAGFDEAMAAAKNAERAIYDRMHTKPARTFADHWAPIERDMEFLRDRVTNRVRRSADSMDNRSAAIMKNHANLAFMGMSALPALQEFGTLIARHGFEQVFRSAFVALEGTLKATRSGTPSAAKMGVIEARKAGAILDVQLGGALAQFAETGMDPTNLTAPERLLRGASSKYFLWNGLAPVTVMLKEIDAAIRVHKMVEMIDNVHLAGDAASPEDLAELARWGISRSDAQKMGKMPIQQTDEGTWLANTEAWSDPDLVMTFRAALRQGNENTILMATAADKPTIADGIIHIRKGRGIVDRAAQKRGLESQGDYWRIESGMLSLPFQFWNYAFAATNKLLIAGVDEPSARFLSGMAAIVGLGWMVDTLRTPGDVRDRRSFGENLASAIDQSGVMGVLPQYAHLVQSSSIGFAGQNPMPYGPRNGYEPGMWDAALNIAGAGPSAANNLIGGALSGDVNQFRWGVPFAGHIAFKGMIDAALDGLR